MGAIGLLIIAIVSEVCGSSLLKLTNGFRSIVPTTGVIISYAISFYALSIALLTLPLGMTYAIWAGLGTALTALIGIGIYKEMINFQKLAGLICIVFGVVLLNL